MDEKTYYQRVYLKRKRGYEVYNNKHKYLAYLNSLTEALYYRDLYSEYDSKTAPSPHEVDLKSKNPYKKGLKYPVPERLDNLKKNKRKKRNYGMGNIQKTSKSSYKIKYAGEYICSCRTYEQAYYVCRELKKHNWDKKYLPSIMDNYPEFYTDLLLFYQHISYDENNDHYFITFPLRKTNGKLERLYYHDVRDALHERDFLKDHDWDYNLLVEAIDDNSNKYMDMDLPPYPERRIRNVQSHVNSDEKILKLIKLLQKDINLSKKEAIKKLNISPATLDNWLRKYGLDWIDIKILVIKNENPLDVMECKKIIYQPDLSIHPCDDFKNYIYVDKTRKSKYRISRNHINYGSYPTRKLALKIVKDLEKTNWDKSQLPSIQEKHGCKTIKRNCIYPNKYGFTIRKKINGKMVGYGVYPNYTIATIVRSFLIKCDWDKNLLSDIRDKSDYVYRVINELKYTKNMGVEVS